MSVDELFGQTITFKTDDPRVRAFSPDGTWTTYSFEWGWLELWLKMGVLGPLAFLGLIAGLVMLYVTQISSPYLNHPLGLGLLMFVVPFFVMPQKAEAEATAKVSAPSVAPASVALAAETK